MLHRVLPYLKVHKITVAGSSWTAAATSETKTLLTIPARTLIFLSIADTTAAYVGLAGTTRLRVGTSTGQDQLVREHDVKTAAIVAGGTDTVGGELPSWSASTTLSATLLSSSGNLGDGTTSNITAGSTAYYFLTLTLP